MRKPRTPNPSATALPAQTALPPASLSPAASPLAEAFARLRFYDRMPKYCWTSPPLVAGAMPRRLVRTFQWEELSYRLTLHATCLVDAEEQAHYRYPGEREELLELTLRKLLCEQRYTQLEGGMYDFSLPQIQAELSRRGHPVSDEELRDSLRVGRAPLEVESADGDVNFSFHRYGMVWLAPTENEPGKTETKLTLSFNRWVEAGIRWNCLPYLDYDLALSLSTALSRQFLKRLTLDLAPPISSAGYRYELALLGSEFGREATEPFALPLRAARQALEALRRREVLADYEIHESMNGDKSLAGARVRLHPTRKFCTATLRQAPCFAYSEGL